MNRKKIIESIMKNIKEKGFEPNIVNENSDSMFYFYKRLKFCYIKSDDTVEIYDTSTDVYRPLTLSELKELQATNVWEFYRKLFIRNTKNSIKNNRRKFHLAIAKKNYKEKNYYYKKAIIQIKKLANFFDINKK